MTAVKTSLQQRIESGQPLVLAEMVPPKSSDPQPVRDRAQAFAGRVHALGVSDNREGAAMSALAAASLVAAEGVEPILHVVTRDRNRIALVSTVLGARALGIGNVLCTTGTHQTLGPARAARNVFDLDSLQLLQVCGQLATDGSVVGEAPFEGGGDYCLGATAAPNADPLELQVLRCAKKVAAGAQFLITQPVFDLERFDAWWAEVTKRGLHEQVAIVAGVEALGDAESARAKAASRPSPRVPDSIIERIAAKGDSQAQQAEVIAIACETIERLRGVAGLRGIEVAGADALTLLDQSGLGVG
jgi:methylenetetrahydrofolate reductase (NADPH)